MFLKKYFSVIPNDSADMAERVLPQFFLPYCPTMNVTLFIPVLPVAASYAYTVAS